jgi:hypothetical protein
VEISEFQLSKFQLLRKSVFRRGQLDGRQVALEKNFSKRPRAAACLQIKLKPEMLILLQNCGSRRKENPSPGAERHEANELDPRLREAGRVTPCAPRLPTSAFGLFPDGAPE